jgi:DNA-binding transcriptional LysR family regulator
MDLAQLEVLVAVAQERGFSRAAERLHRTQPAVSQAVRRLEDEIGEALFDRSSKDGTLTAAGQLLLDYALHMLNLRRDAQQAIHDLRDLQRGKVTLSANEYTVMYLLPVIGAFRKHHPLVKVEVKRSLGSRIPSEVLERDVEIGMVSFQPHNPGLKTVLAAVDELALLVAPGHPLAGRAEVSVRELGVEIFVAHNVRSPYRERVVRTFERHRTPLNIVVELPTLDAIKRLVAEQVGVALMPRLAARSELASGQLVALAVREMRLERRLYLVYRSGTKLSHAARAFLRAARSAKTRAGSVHRRAPSSVMG